MDGEDNERIFWEVDDLNSNWTAGNVILLSNWDDILVAVTSEDGRQGNRREENAATRDAQQRAG